MMNKRGQGLSTNAIILIILGIVILVVLVIGFTMGWNKLAPWLSKENVDEVVNGCNVACETGGQYAFCGKMIELIDDKGNEIETTCLIFSEAPILRPYGIAKCQTLDCAKKPCKDIKINANGQTLVATNQPSCSADRYFDVSSSASDLKTNEKCCVPLPKLK